MVVEEEEEEEDEEGREEEGKEEIKKVRGHFAEVKSYLGLNEHHIAVSCLGWQIREERSLGVKVGAEGWRRAAGC